mgnify:CR=1 FL=1
MNNASSRPGRVAIVGAGPAGLAAALSVHQAGHDVILDRTPLLQKVVGESSPGEIIAQLSAIDEAEQRLQATRAAKPRR